MVFFLVAFGLLLHALFWGAGLALLATPSRWRHCWPVFCAPAGLALQSATVWAGAYAGLAGTNVYGRVSLLLPLLLLGLGLWRRGRGAGRAWRRLGGLWVVMAATLALLVFPLSRASRDLTTNSLGSCDAADYAAGARVLQEFAHGDRGGFLGLTEVVKVASVDNFYDFWLRLNHFTPSALIALNDAVFGLEPYQVTGLLTAVLLVLSLPMAFWMARAVLGYTAAVSLWITAIYGLSPLTWYAVAHVAMSQLIAAQAIALVTWAGIALWRGRLSWRRGADVGGILFIAYWLILGSYNFILLVCLVPGLAYAGGNAVLFGAWRRLARWVGMMMAPLLVCGVIFLERVLGLAERFTLFRQFDFGWRIPALSPEGWLGGVQGTEFEPLGLGVRVSLSLALLGLLLVALGRDSRRGRAAVAYCAVSLTLPILVGYAYLEARGALLGTNASYDAYKLFAVFYPGLLAGFCYWAHLLRSRRAFLRAAAGIFMVLVTLANFSSAQGFVTRMRTPPWSVDAKLVELGRIERMPDVASVNVRIPDMWSRLWANALLLRKPQYFFWHTYEGRRDTFLRGEWDLNGGLIQTTLPGSGTVRINERLALLDTKSPFFVRPRNGEGWFDLEYEPHTGNRWRWTSAVARIDLESNAAALRTTWKLLRVHSLAPRDLQFWIAGKLVATRAVDTGFTDLTVPDVMIPAGGAVLELRTDAPLVVAPGDSRPLGVQIFGIEITVAEK